MVHLDGRTDWLLMMLSDVVAVLENALSQAQSGVLTGVVLVEFDATGAYDIRVEGTAADRLTYSIGAVSMAKHELQHMLQSRRADRQPVRLSVVRPAGA